MESMFEEEEATMKLGDRILLFLKIITCLYLSGCIHFSDKMIFNDYYQGISEAKRLGRNSLLIFDLWSSSSNPEAHLSNPEISEYLDDLVIIHLRVDGTESAVNQNIQKELYGINYQPAYYLLDKNSQIIAGPLGYCSRDEMKHFLDTYLK